MLSNTAVWRRNRAPADNEENKEQTCAEPPFRRQNRPANRYGVATRAQVLTLKEHTGLKIDEIVAITGVGKSEVSNIVKRAKERGYSKEQPLQDTFFCDGERSGRPIQATVAAAEGVVATISATRNTRTLTLVEIARRLRKTHDIGLAPMSIWRLLKRNGYHKVKPTKKPGLSEAQRKARLAWCLEHKDWTLEDWKRVLWSDETSVVYGTRRGGERVWRTVYEVNTKTCRRSRWKGFSDFMFWGCFSWHHKGPCYIWTKETAAEKKAAAADLAKRNELKEPACRAEWELNSRFQRHVRIRDQARGKEPIWKFTEARGKLVRNAKAGGIDWYRYQEIILKKKLLPFAKKHNLIVQEDGAPSHTHSENVCLYNIWDVTRLLWPGNSPDLNMIEPCWWWMKRQTSLHKDYDKKPQLRDIWLKTWKELDQPRIQRWIRRIVRHIREVIELEGGNGYREGGEDTPIDQLSKQLQNLSMN
jgi:transposase